MEISKRQQEEVDFFSKTAKIPFQPTDEEIKEYLDETVRGIKIQHSNAWQKRNRISESKRLFDITIPMWKEDLVKGMLVVDELKEDFKEYPYGIRLIDSIIKGITPHYRNKILQKALEKKEEITLNAFTNFPNVMLCFKG